MKRLKPLITAGLMLAALSPMPTHAGNIVLVRMGGHPVYPSSPDNTGVWFTTYGTNNCDRLGSWTEQVEIGWTNTDDTFVAALTNAGHRVTTYWLPNSNISDSDLARLNTNDLLILSFSINSGPMNQSGGNVTAPCNSTNTGHKWNTLITAPMILTKANLARAGANRLGWFTSISSNDWATTAIGTQITPSDFDSANDKSTTASGKLTIVDHNNPLFAGITYTNNGSGNRVMSNYFTLNISQDLSNPNLANYFTPIPSIPYPGPGGVNWPLSPGTLYNRGNTPATLKIVVGGVEQGPGGPGTSYTNDLSPGGRILATLEFNPFTDPASDPSTGDNPPQGTAPVPEPTWVVTGVAIAEWPEGSKAFRGCTDPGTGDVTFCDDLGGYRMLFAAGARDPNITTQDSPTGGRAAGFFAGAFDLSRDGEKIFRRAVDRAILKGKNPSLSVARSGGNTVVSWNAAVRTWKLQASTNLSTWTDVTSGVSNNSYTVPGGAPTAQFFRLTVIP